DRALGQLADLLYNIADPTHRLSTHVVIGHRREDVDVGRERRILLADDRADGAGKVRLSPGDAKETQLETRAQAIHQLTRFGHPVRNLLTLPDCPFVHIVRKDGFCGVALLWIEVNADVCAKARK